MKRYRYPYHRYNRFDVLRVNPATIGAVLFLSRHVLTFLVLGIALSRAPASGREAFSGILEPIYMLSDIPALLVFLAMLARHPKTGRALRLVWRSGPLLLPGSTLIYLGLVIRQVGSDPANYGWLLGAVIAGALVASTYVVLSPYARELFREFPDPSLAEDATGKS
jgi:Protein of unknown function (DUF2919)